MREVSGGIPVGVCRAVIDALYAVGFTGECGQHIANSKKAIIGKQPATASPWSNEWVISTCRPNSC